MIVPHLRGGRLIKIYAKYAKKLSAVDDGLDTFREQPRNIDVLDFELGANYYTFNYDFSLAGWLVHFNLINVCDINEIAKNSKKTLDLNNFDVVLVESPGIELLDKSNLSSSNVFLVKHSNPNKSIDAFANYQSISGSEFALEDSLKTYKGRLIIGESMTAVYALLQRLPAFKLMLVVNEDNKKNLSSLIDLVRKKEFAKLLVTKK